MTLTKLGTFIIYDHFRALFCFLFVVMLCEILIKELDFYFDYVVHIGISWFTLFAKDTGSGSSGYASFICWSFHTNKMFLPEMSAHEDFVDLDKEGFFFNGPVADKSFEIRENEEGF